MEPPCFLPASDSLPHSLAPPSRPPFVAGASRWADTLTFFRPVPATVVPGTTRARPPPDDTPAIPPLPFADDRSPLYRWRARVWGVFAALLAFTLFAFLAVVVFAHTP
jgi:hypothetical protein